MIKRLIKYFFPTIQKVEVVKKEVIVQTISYETLNSLRARLPNCQLSSSDSAEVASHKLGVQLALRELEKGFVV